MITPKHQMRNALNAWYRAYKAAQSRRLTQAERAECRNSLRCAEKDLSAACYRRRAWLRRRREHAPLPMR